MTSHQVECSSWSNPMPFRPREPRQHDTRPKGSVASVAPSSSDRASHSPVPVEMDSCVRSRISSKCPEDLDLSAAEYRTYRDRSPTASTMSSCHQPDSATTCSMPMSPASSIFTRATTPDMEAMHSKDVSQRHRSRISYDSGFMDSLADDDVPPESPVIKYHAFLDAPSTPLPGQADVPTPRPEVAESKDVPSAVALEHRLKERFSFERFSERLQVPRHFVAEPAMQVSEDEADDVLDYVLCSTYGVELSELAVPPALLRQVASRFIQDIGRLAFDQPLGRSVAHTNSNTSQRTVPISRAPGSNRSSQGGSGSNSKRKKSGQKRDGEEEAEDLSEEDGDAGVPSTKRVKQTPREPDENLRLSCPFRKRNPGRFNVREHHSCAMTYFPKFAELRQHIIKQHKRIDPTVHICDRCNGDFLTAKDLRDHRRLPKDQICDTADHDPESGIDGPTANKLLSRKRASGTSPEVQWKEIWNLIFPDDDDRDVRDWDYCPVIEHFEVMDRFMQGLDTLEGSMLNKGVNQSLLETIGNLYRNQFIQVVEQCVGEARAKPYSNRSNRKPDTPPVVAAAPASLMNYIGGSKPRFGSGNGSRGPRPDSGVDLDDGYSEGDRDSLSVALFSSLGAGIGLADGLGVSMSTSRRSSSTGTEVKFGHNGYPSGAGGRSLTPLMEQRVGQGLLVSNAGGSFDTLQQQQQQPRSNMFNDQAGVGGSIDGMPVLMSSGMWPDVYYSSSNGGSMAPTPGPGQSGGLGESMTQSQQPVWGDQPRADGGQGNLYDFSNYTLR